MERYIGYRINKHLPDATCFSIIIAGNSGDFVEYVQGKDVRGKIRNFSRKGGKISFIQEFPLPEEGKLKRDISYDLGRIGKSKGEAYAGACIDNRENRTQEKEEAWIVKVNDEKISSKDLESQVKAYNARMETGQI